MCVLLQQLLLLFQQQSGGRGSTFLRRFKEKDEEESPREWTEEYKAASRLAAGDPAVTSVMCTSGQPQQHQQISSLSAKAIIRKQIYACK